MQGLPRSLRTQYGWPLKAICLTLAPLLTSGVLQAQNSFWSGTATPTSAEATNDTQPVTLGLRFQSDKAGVITGVRFYKGPTNTGTHVGTLWSGSGAPLASVVFAGESASGWQQANFATPISISTNTPYVISYFAPKGAYASDPSFAWSSLTSGNLHTVGSSPGVYAYGGANTFPTSSWSGTNYWVDVAFSTGQTSAVSGLVDGGAGSTVKLSGDASLSTVADASGRYTFTGISAGKYTITPQKAGLAFSPANRSITVGTASVTGQDFTGTPAYSLWPSPPEPTVPEALNDRQSVNVGVDFYSDVPGTVTGVRFYKGTDNGGLHTGTLWDRNSGAQIATVQLTNESASGWQQANFPAPVSITPNTHYVISYLATGGAYAADEFYPWTSIDPTPLHFSSLTPGLYAYGSTPTMPSQSYNGTNYWVDVVFVPASSTAVSNPGSFSISGTVIGSGATLTLTGASSTLETTAVSGGTFVFGGLPNGTYQITPGEAGYTFDPPSRTVTVNGSSIANANFAAASNALTAAPILSVKLSWTASSSTSISGYNIYRSTTAGGPYTKINSSLATGTAYNDTSAPAGKTVYYVSTSVDSSGQESSYSNETSGVAQ